MAENKTQPTKLSVAKFIETITDETRRADAKALVKMMQGASGEKPTMWGPAIVGFGSVHYKYDSGREGDMPMIGFSPRKAASVLYGAIGFTRRRCAAGKARQTHDRQGLPLHQEAVGCGPESAGGNDGEGVGSKAEGEVRRAK